MQPIVEDENGTLRFKENKIVEHLLDNGGFDMNDIARLNFSVEDREQFAQLIGYSLSGYGELHYVRDETYSAAEKMHENGQTEEQAMNEHLTETLSELREELKKPIAKLYGIHPDDLDD